MRLKHLRLLGFKTFAPRTDVLFGEGLTAVVGPNGSGKSNVADAIRWALGEQSLSQLRAKRTEDLIFAGSSNRAPLGMAEVSITIDNADRLLPLDFSEVTITRRAYRSGENEYYINKSRVRLREVVEVASTLGQAYTVVGQGLVDAALSARPDERRELFEEAAAIRGYFVQREDALRRLSKTEENVARVSDLASELEPQVRRMERQARQAQDFLKLDDELRTLMKRWYVLRWLAADEEFARSRQLEEAAQADVDKRKIEVAARSAQVQEVRARVWQLVDDVSSMHEERARVQARHAAAAQAQAVLSERLSASAHSREALEREQHELDSSIQSIAKQLSGLRDEIKVREDEIAKLESAGKEVTSRLSALDSEIDKSTRLRAKHASELESVERRKRDLQNRSEEAHRQVGEQESAAHEAELAIAGLQKRLAADEVLLEERHSTVAADQRKLAQSEAEQAAARANLQQARASLGSAESAARESARRGDTLAAQIAALAGEQQAGLFGGVRAVVQSAGSGRLEGYVGTVAELLRVPGEYEVAVEAALGGRLQDVVMERWADAERAISHLKQTGAGRATFLPLDTIRSSPAPAPPRGPGIVGLARDLVSFEERLGTLAEMLLGRLLIVEDLPSARKTVTGLSGNAPWTLATIGGEVVRPGGSVTGGSNARADDAKARGRTILARERRRRDLQQAQSDLKTEQVQVEQALQAALSAVREAEREVARVDRAVEDARRALSAAQMSFVEQQGKVSRETQEMAWRTGLLSQTRNTIEAQKAAAEESVRRRAEVEDEAAPLLAAIAEVDREIGSLGAERSRIAQAAGAGQTKLAVQLEGIRNLRARVEELQRDEQRYSARLNNLKARAEQAAVEERALRAQIDQHGGEVARLNVELQDLDGRVGPAEREVRVLEGEVSRLEGELSAMQSALLECETRHSRAAVESQRCLGTLESLSIEISEELREDGDAPLEFATVGSSVIHEPSHEQSFTLAASGGASPYVVPPAALRPSLQANGHVSGQESMSELERQVRALKVRLSRLGPVNPLAAEEYTALSERHSYLQSQLTDLLAAADALRRVIGELDRTMRDQFAVTFAQVNEAFQYFFNKLFAGGSARLELTNPQDVAASGIEIYAQPPGKRMQPLAALSGGERALTSVALLCALLKVRPVPFCVLDEVDAALDESNVTRFRDALQELGSRTQFVVITHNRGTIEAADTLYGVSMAGDGTSQMLSLNVAP